MKRGSKRLLPSVDILVLMTVAGGASEAGGTRRWVGSAGQPEQAVTTVYVEASGV